MRWNKYNAKITIVDGIKFRSKLEANRYKTLKILERTKIIKDLKLQVPFSFLIDGKKIFRYYADFAYNMEGKDVIEDAKGCKTTTYKLKKKLIEAQFKISINEFY